MFRGRGQDARCCPSISVEGTFACSTSHFRPRYSFAVYCICKQGDCRDLGLSLEWNVRRNISTTEHDSIALDCKSGSERGRERESVRRRIMMRGTLREGRLVRRPRHRQAMAVRMRMRQRQRLGQKRATERVLQARCRTLSFCVGAYYHAAYAARKFIGQQRGLRKPLFERVDPSSQRKPRSSPPGPACF